MASNYLDISQILPMLDDSEDEDRTVDMSDDGNESDLDRDIVIPGGGGESASEEESSSEDEDAAAEDAEDAGGDAPAPNARQRRPRRPRPAAWPTPNWSDQIHDFADLEDFRGSPGINPNLECLLDSKTTPYEYFQLFVPETFYDDMAEQTNLYAAYDKKCPKSWEPVDVAAIKQYLYVNFMFGIHNLNDYKNYWSEDELLKVSAISSVMPRRRYEQINRFFHLNDNNAPRAKLKKGEEGFDPLYKVRPLMDLVRNGCINNFYPGCEVAIDEAMISFTGRLFFKQYMKGKPIPWGIKVWCCADSKTGYIFYFRVYTGKFEQASDDGQGFDVVMEMGRLLLDKWHHFYFDNFFTSVKLAEKLLSRNTYMCGTIRTNRKGWPKDLRAKKKKKDDPAVKYRQSGNLLATQWFDKRVVNVLSSNSQPRMTETMRNTAEGRVPKEIPVPIKTYNSFMGGVDLHDQYRSYYSIGRRTVKWWRNLVWFLFQVSILNAYQLYKAYYMRSVSTIKMLSHFEFRLEIIRSLRQTSSRKRCREVPTPSPRTIEKCTSIRMLGNKKRCHQCKKHGRKTASQRLPETVYGCNKCFVHICQGDCFHEHLQEQYK